MLRLGILTIFLFTCLIQIEFTLEDDSQLSDPTKTASSNIIYINEKSSKTIRLKSVLSLNSAIASTNSRNDAVATAQLAGRKNQKIFWSFKRLYAMPNWTNSAISRTQNELSQVELMISLDAEVEDNLKLKYSTSNDSDLDNMYDLIINNLTYADAGLYKCNLWNQKVIYYHLIVSSPITKPTITLDQPGLSTNNMVLESTDLGIKCQSKHAYPYPSFKWFENGVEIKPNQAEIVYRQIDKETNTIESVLKLRKIKSSYHLKNMSCKIVQHDLSDLTNVRDASNLEQLWQISDTLTLNVAFKPIVRLEVFKMSGNTNGAETINSLKLGSFDTHSLTPSRIYLYQNDEDVLFSCKFKSNPIDQISIVWKLNGVVQNQGESNNYDVFSWKKRSNRNDLSLKKMNLSCEVENLIGKSSYMVEITQLYEPRLKLNTTYYQIDEFSTFQLNCSTDASPSVNLIEWRKYANLDQLETATTNNKLGNENDGNDNNYEVVSTDSLLDFKSIKHAENAGYYICATLNSMNDSFGQVKFGDRKYKFELDIRFRPEMSQMAKKLAATVLPPQQQLNPEVEKPSKSFNHTPMGQNISCLCMANPQPIFNWYKNGVKLNENINPSRTNNGSSKSALVAVSNKKYVVLETKAALNGPRNLYESILTINDVDENDLNNKYECEAMNQMGVDRFETELVAMSKPDRPTELRALYVDFMTIGLTWLPGFDGGLEQTFYLQLNDTLIEISTAMVVDPKLSVRLIRVNSNAINLTRLAYNTLYSIRLVARNKLGSSEWSDSMLIRTTDLTESSASLLPQLDSLFLNVPKNRLEFGFKSSSNGEVSSSKKTTDSNNDTVNVSMLIPICLNVESIVLGGRDENEFDAYNFKKCLPFEGDYYALSQYVFDGLDESELRLYKGKEPTSEVFNSKSVKSMKVSVCFMAKPSICTNKPTSAIIDMYNKMSHSSIQFDRNDKENYFNEFNLNGNGNRKFSFMSANSKIPIALVIGVCVCIFTLSIFLFVTVIYCIRKRNFKLCKALLSQADSNGNIEKSSTGSSSGSSSVSSGDGKKQIINDKSREISTIVSESSSSSSSDRKQSHTNKSFNIDIASISAPMKSTISINGAVSGHLSSNNNSTSSADLHSHTLGGMPINSSSLLSSVSKTNSLNSRRAFTAALTATANNIIGKHKQQHSLSHHVRGEILVTEDEDKIKKQQQQQSHHHFQATLCNHFEDEGQHSEETGSENDDGEKNTIQVASSQTSSTAVSNCSSTHLGPPYSLYSPFESHQMGGGGKNSLKVGFCSDSTGSNSDPIAINNSLSSNSTTESPTYGYNVTNSTQTSSNQRTNFNRQEDELIYIKQQQQQQQQLEDSQNVYSKNGSLMFKQQKSNTSSSSSSKNSTSFGDSGQQQVESGYSTPSRPKKVVYEVIV